MTLAEHQARCLALEKESKRLTAACKRLKEGSPEYAAAALAMFRKAQEWQRAADAYARAADADAKASAAQPC